MPQPTIKPTIFVPLFDLLCWHKAQEKDSLCLTEKCLHRSYAATIEGAINAMENQVAILEYMRDSIKR